MVKLSSNHLRIIKTCNLYLAFFMLGLSIAISGPCLLDLQHMVGTDTEHIALIYTAKSIGYLIGSGIGGVLMDLLKSKQALIALCSFVASATRLGIPWSRSIEALVGFMIVNAACLGAIENGCTVICLNLWGARSGPVFQGLHFTFGLGGLVAPLIAAPYLGDYSSETSSTSNTTYLNQTSLNSTCESCTNNSTSFNTSLPQAISSVPNIIYPFSYIGAFCSLVGIMFLAICIISPTEDGQKESDHKDNSKRSFRFMSFVVFMNFFLIFVGTGMEIGYAQLLTTYAVKSELHLSTTVGSYMTSVFWAAFTISRLASVFLAIKLKNVILMIGDIALASVAALVLLFLMPNEWALWLASVVFGVGIASFYPAAIGWLNEHITVTSKIASIFAIGAAAGEMVVPFVISLFIGNFPDIFSYVITAACVLTAIGMCLLYAFFEKYDKKKVETHKADVYLIRTSSVNI